LPLPLPLLSTAAAAINTNSAAAATVAAAAVAVAVDTSIAPLLPAARTMAPKRTTAIDAGGGECMMMLGSQDGHRNMASEFGVGFLKDVDGFEIRDFQSLAHGAKHKLGPPQEQLNFFPMDHRSWGLCQRPRSSLQTHRHQQKNNMQAPR